MKASPWRPCGRRTRSARRRSATPATSSTRSATKYSLAYYVKHGEGTGADGRARPRDQGHGGTVPALCGREAGQGAAGRRSAFPIHFHTHDTSGINAASILKAAEARRGRGRRRHRLHERHHQPAESEFDRRGAGAHDARYRARSGRAQRSAPITGKWCASTTRRSTRARSPAAAEVYLHEMPGGQYTNLKEQAESMGLGARWHEIARTYAEVNHGLRRHRQGDAFEQSGRRHGHLPGEPQHDDARSSNSCTPDHNLTLPIQRDRHVHGIARASPTGGWPKQLQKIILRGAKPQRGRPGAHLPPVDLEETAAAVEKKIGRKPLHDEVLSYLMYPDVFLKFAQGAAELGRRGRAAHAAVLLRDGAGKRHDRGTRARQGAGHQVPDDRRAASRRHAYGLLRTERPAARGHDPRPPAGGDASRPSPRPTRTSRDRSARPSRAWSRRSPWN